MTYFHKKSVSRDYGVLGHQIAKENLKKKQALLKNFNADHSWKESQIRDLWNLESKSDINRSDGG